MDSKPDPGKAKNQISQYTPVLHNERSLPTVRPSDEVAGYPPYAVPATPVLQPVGPMRQSTVTTWPPGAEYTAAPTKPASSNGLPALKGSSTSRFAPPPAVRESQRLAPSILVVAAKVANSSAG